MTEGGSNAERWARQLAEQGYVDFGLKLWKLIPSFFLGAAVAAVGFIVFRAVEGEGDLGAYATAVGVLGLIWPVISLPPLWPGPALRVHQSGITVRRWWRPIEIPWHEIVEVVNEKDLFIEVVPATMARWAADWRVLRSARHMDDETIWVSKLDARTTDLASWLTAEVDARVPIGPAPRLLLSGKEIAIEETMRWTTVDKLDISAELRTSILDWDRRTDENADSEAPMDMRVQVWESQLLPEGRNLAVHLERELGPGARVTLFDDWSEAQER